MITTKGLGFLVVAVVLFLLAGLTQVGWVYLVDAVLWGIIVLSAAFPWLGFAFVSAERRVEPANPRADTPGPAEGDLFRVSVTLRKRAFWPSYFLGMFYDCPASAPENHRQQFFVTEMYRSGKVSLESTIEAYRRGLHQLGPLVAESSAPFGLFRRWARLTGSYPLLVYPKVYPLRRLAWADGLSGSSHQAKKSRTGYDPAGSRKYAVGDPRRLVHWRNTARTGQLMVKEVEDPTDRVLYLAFDATKSWGEGRENTLEYGIKILASAVDCAHRNQIPVKLLGGGLGGQRGGLSGPEPHHTRNGWPSLLKDLALVSQGDGPALTETLAKIPPGATAMAVVSPADRRAVEALVRTSTMLHHLVVVTLEGFGEPQKSEARLRPLQAAGIQVVRCWWRGLEEAIRSLETLPGPSHPQPTGLEFDANPSKPSGPSGSNIDSETLLNRKGPKASSSLSQGPAA